MQVVQDNDQRLVGRCALEERGVEIWRFPGKHRVPLKPLLRRLARRGMISILVEGGGQVLGSFFDQKLVDKVQWFRSLSASEPNHAPPD